MQLLPQVITALTPSMTIEDAKVKDLRVSAHSVPRNSLSISIALILLLLLLLLPLPLPINLQRTAGWCSGEIQRACLCESRDLDHTSLVGVFIVGASAARDRDAEVVLCASQRYADDSRIS